MRDRREDTGQYYPGGRVVPKTPTGQGGGGTSDYDQLANKPKINNHELTGNKTAAQLGLATPSDIPDVIGKLPLRALPPYLHYLAFDDTYPEDAAWLYAQLGPSDMGRCSAVRRGSKLFRNYDWTFDSAAEFVVRMRGNASRYASVGVASVGARLTDNDVMSAVNSIYYKCLPGMTLDGINEKGVVCEINVDGGPKTDWHGDAEEDGIHILAAVRWVLDNGETAAQAAEWIADHIIQPQGEMNFHFMVADATSTYIVENGVAHDVTDGTKVLTNYGVFDSAQAGEGKERYTLLAEGADIKSVWFTNAYQQGNDWDSDFESREQHLDAIDQWFEQGETKEAHRGKTSESGLPWWQSVHTTEYDFAAKTMKVAVQEVDDWYTFAVGQANVETDDTMTRTSANPVKSSGIWSAIWGALTALPIGFSSLYDWCVSKLAEKRDKTDRAVYQVTRTENTDWTWTSENAEFVPVLNSAGTKPAFNTRIPNTWYCIQPPPGYSVDPDPRLGQSASDLSVKLYFSNGDNVYSATATRPRYMDESVEQKSNQQIASVATGDAQTPANGDIVKYDSANDRFVKAEKSSTSADPANADYRDPQDNTCHKTELSKWVITTPGFDPGSSQPVYSEGMAWIWDIDGQVFTYYGPESDLSGVFWHYNPETEETLEFTATRSSVCTSGKKFVTEDVVAKQADIFGNDGKPNDTFATDLLGKQVAISAMKYGLASTSATVKAADRTVTKVTLGATAVTVTFPDADENGKTRDFLLRIDAANFETGGSLTITKPTGATIYGDAFPSPEATKQYLVAITETAANEFYVRTIEITIPTEA